MPRARQFPGSGFTLPELLVCLAIVALLAALALPALARTRDSAMAAKCLANMRTLGNGVLGFAAEHGEFPRSSHSAFAHRSRGWSRLILPWLGHPEDVPNARWRELRAKYFKCPSDTTASDGQSYGLNVFFELDPDFDDYLGSPEQWRRPQNVPNPASTILIAETSGNTDHVMSHFWEGESSAGLDCAHDRHDGKANYVFADGSVRRLPLKEVYAPSQGINRWNPSF